MFLKRFYEELICVKSINNCNCQSLVVGCLSLFFCNYSSLLHFKSQWAQSCDTYIPDCPWDERPFNILIVQIRLILILKNRTEVFSTETIDSNFTKLRNQIQFSLFWFTCFDFLWKILKSEKENQASGYMIIGYCEPLVFNIHGYWVVSKVVFNGYMLHEIMETNTFLQFFSS